ncbi:uncharacterized protein LOC144129467 [Amblyomma americanum]
MNKLLASTFKHHQQSKHLYFRLICWNGSAPAFYGLPKIHKPGVPLRPIVDFTTSPLRALSAYLHRFLSPLTGNPSTHVRNSSHFVERLSHVQLEADECVVSFNVVSLFTSVLVPFAAPAAKQALEVDADLSTRTSLNPEELCRLLEFCLSSTAFSFRGEFYKQTSSAAISVTAANLTMEAIEEDALMSLQEKPKVFIRYTDDCFCILKT